MEKFEGHIWNEKIFPKERALCGEKMEEFYFKSVTHCMAGYQNGLRACPVCMDVVKKAFKIPVRK